MSSIETCEFCPYYVYINQSHQLSLQVFLILFFINSTLFFFFSTFLLTKQYDNKTYFVFSVHHLCNICGDPSCVPDDPHGPSLWQQERSGLHYHLLQSRLLHGHGLQGSGGGTQTDHEGA